MTKVTIANYLVGNLSNRFPIAQSGIIDHDIIDVIVDGWQNNHYQTLVSNVRERKSKTSQQRYLM